MLATQGVAYDINSGCVLACSSQVTHFVMSNYDEGADKIDGEPQVCKLPFKWPEGDVASEDIMWLNFPTDCYVPYKGAEHKQFLMIMAIKLNSVLCMLRLCFLIVRVRASAPKTMVELMVMTKCFLD